MIVALVGAGALGTLLGWSLAGENDVRILVRDERAADGLRARGGLQLEGQDVRRVAVSHDAAGLRGAGVAFVAVKSYDTVAALAPLRGVLPATSPVVSVQNGAEAAAQVRRALGVDAPVALAPTTEAATLLCPGLARRTAGGTTRLGWARGYGGEQRAGDALFELAATMTRCGLRCEVVAPVEPHVWAKLVANAALNPLTALEGVPNGAVFERADLRGRAARIACEVAAVANAAGIALPFDDPVAHVEKIARATAANRSSMLRDLERGRQTEIEAIDGAVVRRANELGIAVAETARVLDEVRARAKA